VNKFKLIGIPHSFYHLENLDDHQGDHAGWGIESSGTHRLAIAHKGNQTQDGSSTSWSSSSKAPDYTRQSFAPNVILHTNWDVSWCLDAGRSSLPSRTKLNRISSHV
jgi:hypothetical protein